MSLLLVKDLTHYFSGLLAVSNFNLCVEKGELLGLIGPNGAGKSTVFNLVTGIYRAKRGSICFDGKELVGRSTSEIAAAGVARTFQNIRLFKTLSVFDNVRAAFFSRIGYSALESVLHVGRYFTRESMVAEEAERLLAILGMEGVRDERAASLPYGLQRRLEIARALALNPKLLLLDEPAAGMNPIEIDELNSLILRLKNEFDLTILLIEHQMRLVMGVCERIVVLDFGETIAEGSPSEIQTDRRVLEAYLGEDFK